MAKGILFKTLATVSALKELILHPKDSLTTLYLNHENRWTNVSINPFPQVDIFSLLTPPPHTDFDNLHACPVAMLSDGSTVLDYALLKGLAKKISIRGDLKYLEIGTWRGESCANVAEYAKYCTCITLPDSDVSGYFSNNEQKSNYINTSKYYIKNLKNVEMIFADSKLYDFSKLEKSYNLIFIDGDHDYEGVLSDTKNIFKIIDTENTIIVWHDYSYGPEKVRLPVFRAIYESTPKKLKNRLYHVSNTMCAIYYPFSIESYPMPTFPSIPQRTFMFTISKFK